MLDAAGEQHVIPAIASNSTAAAQVASIAHPLMTLQEVFPFAGSAEKLKSFVVEDALEEANAKVPMHGLHPAPKTPS